MSSTFANLVDLLSLPPDRLWPAIGVLAALVVTCELTRIALLVVLVRSVVAHVVVCLLTFALPAIVLAAVLLFADLTHPGRGLTNLGIAAAMYGLWYLTGESTRLVRADSEGADLGFMTVGALITFPLGLVGALLS